MEAKHIEDYIELIEGEVWKEVSHSPMYWISNNGRLFSWKSRYKYTYKPYGLIKGGLNRRRGWRWISLDYGSPEALHRIVAKAHVPNPFNRPEVKHLNGDLQDNRACNLEWICHSESFTP